MMRLRRSLVALLPLLSLSLPAFALNLSEETIQGVTNAYGLIGTQSCYLTRIAKDHPDRAAATNAAQQSFDQHFPDLLAKIEGEIKLWVGTKGLAEYQTTLNKVCAQKYPANITNNIDIDDFLRTVKANSAGNFGTVTPYILALQYQDQPVEELHHGFVLHFKSEGTDSTKGYPLSLDMPLSWKARLGDSATTLATWVSENGTGLEYISVDVSEAKGDHAQPKHIADEITLDGKKKKLPKDTYQVTNLTTALGDPAFWVRFAVPSSVVGKGVSAGQLSYTTFHQGKQINVNCMITVRSSNLSVTNAGLDRITPLCQQIVSSLNLP
jgi:hypothetical protein